MSEEHHGSKGTGMYAFQIASAIICAGLMVVTVIWWAGILFPPPANQANAYEIDYPDRELHVARAQNVNLAAAQVAWPAGGMPSIRDREKLAHNRELLKSNPSALTKVAYVDTTDSVRTRPSAPKVELPLPNLLATADIARGEVVAKKCLSCHTFGLGGSDSTGPNLWNVVGDARARNADFNYSPAMVELKCLASRAMVSANGVPLQERTTNRITLFETTDLPQSA